jgi:hypothetical protein
LKEFLMAARTVYEKRILKELEGLPESALKKIEKVIRILKNDFLDAETVDKDPTEKLLSLCGSWKDKRTVQEQIEDVYSSRVSSEDREVMR